MFDRCKIQPLTSFPVLSLSVIIHEILAFVTIFVFVKNKDIDENTIQIILIEYFRFDKKHELITENGASVGLVSIQTDVDAP